MQINKIKIHKEEILSNLSFLFKNYHAFNLKSLERINDTNAINLLKLIKIFEK